MAKKTLEPISKIHLGYNRLISAAAAFSELIVFTIQIIPVAAVSLENSFDLAFKAIFEIASV